MMVGVCGGTEQRCILCGKPLRSADCCQSTPPEQVETTDAAELVARALHSIEDSWNDHTWEQLPETVQILFGTQAQAAILAMREHLTAKLSASEAALEQIVEETKYVENPYAKAAWKIARAALARQEPEGSGE